MPTVIPTCLRCDEYMVVRHKKQMRVIKDLGSFIEIKYFWACPQCDYSEYDTNPVSVSSTDSVQESTPTDCPC